MSLAIAIYQPQMLRLSFISVLATYAITILPFVSRHR